MTEVENGTTTLGKHARDDVEDVVPDMPSADVDDSSDEEIGPMPTAGDASGSAISKARKKKKRASELTVTLFGDVTNVGIVLPHEKLYLEHLPDTDRYYKSFMHRDTIDFVCVTK